MKIEKLSTNGFKVSDVFDEIQLAKIVDLINTVPVTAKKLTPNGHREDYGFDVGDTRDNIVNCFVNDLESIVPVGVISTVSLWRDYNGYVNSLHYDCECFKHIMIVYLGDGNNGVNGTRWIEDDQEYSVPYSINTGLILLNSEFVLHGMIGSVENMDYRRTMYMGWS